MSPFGNAAATSSMQQLNGFVLDGKVLILHSAFRAALFSHPIPDDRKGCLLL
jgi:hypothetical protein